VRSASRLGWLQYVVALGLVGLVTGLWLVVHRRVTGAVGYEHWHEGMVNGLAFATVGAVIATRRPEHPVGWLFLGAGLVGAAQLATGGFAGGVPGRLRPIGWRGRGRLGLLPVPAGGRWPADRHAAGVSHRPTALPALVGAGMGRCRQCGAHLGRRRAGASPLRGVPRGREPVWHRRPCHDAQLGRRRWGVLAIAGFLGALASLMVRFARARGLERQQLKWFVYAAGLGVAVLFLPNLIPGASGVAGTLAWTLVPANLSAAAAVAVLRYRLYDIDAD